MSGGGDASLDVFMESSWALELFTIDHILSILSAYKCLSKMASEYVGDVMRHHRVPDMWMKR